MIRFNSCSTITWIFGDPSIQKLTCFGPPKIIPSLPHEAFKHVHWAAFSISTPPENMGYRFIIEWINSTINRSIYVWVACPAERTCITLSSELQCDKQKCENASRLSRWKATGLGALFVPSTTREAEARKALQHGRLRDFTGSANWAEKRLWPHDWPQTGKTLIFACDVV